MVHCENPCPCRFFGSGEKECTCSGAMIDRYQKRLSGPLLDRIDIHVEVPRVPFQKLSDDRRGEPLAAIRARVEAARDRHHAPRSEAEWETQRFAGSKLTGNADTLALPDPVPGHRAGAALRSPATPSLAEPAHRGAFGSGTGRRKCRCRCRADTDGRLLPRRRTCAATPGHRHAADAALRPYAILLSSGILP
jgi:hypothetical protein